MSEPTIDEMLAEMESVAEIEGTEVGAVWMSLAVGKTAADYGSEEYRDAYNREVKAQYAHFKECFRIVVRTETQKVTYKELEFIG